VSSFFGRIRDIVGLPGADDYDDYVEYDEDDVLVDEGYDDAFVTAAAEQSTVETSDLDSIRNVELSPKRSNVVDMSSTGRFGFGASSEVLVIEPKAFEEMPQVIQALRDRKSVVLNLTMMEPLQAQRAVDFVAGATYTIDGHQERVGESIFLFTPNCVQVRTQAEPVQTEPKVQPTRVNANAWQNDPVINRVAQ
jgi:cell division inhibitor SepF